MSGVTQAEVVAAAGAERLLSDPILTEALDELVRMHTQRAIVDTDPLTRESSRNMVLAIGELRNALSGAIEYVLEARKQGHKEKSFE
jgi:hypothetical protein